MDFDLKYEVDEDLLICNDIWRRFSHDADKLEGLFNNMLFKYVNIIEGFSENMEVISPYDEKNKQAEALRYNVSIIISRLEIVKAQNYRTDGLREYYLKEGVQGHAVQVDFNEARKIISNTKKFGALEKNEILDKIDEIDEICTSVAPKNAKWSRLRPYVVWASGKDVATALLILSLIQRIN